MSPAEIIAAGALLLILLPIILFDLRERRIPNQLNLLLAATGLAYRACTAASWTALATTLLSALIVIAMFMGLIGAMKLLRRSGTLGLGDVKFLAAASIWVGFVGTTLVFVLASLFALIFTLARAPWRQLDFRAAIPFAPFLAISLALIFTTSASFSN